jgi:hypothetical protein
MNIEELIKTLPSHWELIGIDNIADHYYDDGRDYDQPMFVRKDGLARIYFNAGEDETTEYLFGVAYDWHCDGDCYGNFSNALEAADRYVEAYPLVWDEETKEYK